MVTGSENRDSKADALRKEFHSNYGSGRDFEGLDLIDFIIGAGRFVSDIIGANMADRGMAEIVRALGYVCEADEDWPVVLEREAIGDAYTWRMGARFHDLNAYAYYGIALNGGRTPEEREVWIRSLIDETSAFIAKIPLDPWGLRAGDVYHTHRLALGRWALDNNDPIDPYALAEFGDVTERRIRNLMAGSERAFASVEGGKVPAKDALGWLRSRSSFRHSVWRDQSVFEDLAGDRPSQLEEVYFVPIAKDGTVFHPGLLRDGVYTIGDESHELTTPSFEEALAAVQRLPFPTWRRPSPHGVWTMVRGVRWERLSKFELERAANAAA